MISLLGYVIGAVYSKILVQHEDAARRTSATSVSR